MAEKQTSGGILLARWRPIAIGLAVLVGLNALAFAFVVQRAGSRADALAEELELRVEELDAADAQIVSLERVASKLACTESDIAYVFEERLSSKVERMTAIMREVRQVADSVGTPPERIQYTPQLLRGESGLWRFALSFPMEGPYATLRDFIRKIEGSEHFLVIQDISMDGERAQGANLKLQVRVNTYLLNPDPEVLERLIAASGGQS